MEPAKIDWKRLEWKFVEDELYEHINAPKWVDFLAPDQSIDDEAWFCRHNCKHPKTAEDFLRSTASKPLSSAYVPENLPLGDQNRREVKIKRRVPTLSSASPQDCKSRFKEDSENQNPNLFTPPNNPLKPTKAAIKSSEEKKKLVDDTFQDSEVPSLRSTLSAKNLFPRRPILNQITEFCNELKRLATRARERENAENLSPKMSEEVMEKASPSVQAFAESNGREKERNPLLEAGKASPSVQAFAESNGREKERKPLLEVGKAERAEGECVKWQQQRKKRPEETENMPVSLDLENLRHKKEENLQQIRTNPPSPQCFSATRGPNKTNPSKAAKSRLMERGTLQEVEPNKEIAKQSPACITSTAIVDGRETKPIDVFWFLKPCTLSG